MTTTSQPASPVIDVEVGRPSTARLARTGAIAGLVAAAATCAVAGIAAAADVPLVVDGTAIPVPAFAVWTVVGAVLGVVLARVLRRPRRFVAVTTALVAVSLIPPIAAPDDTATAVVLVATHLLAAGIIVGSLARDLRSSCSASRAERTSPQVSGAVERIA